MLFLGHSVYTVHRWYQYIMSVLVLLDYSLETCWVKERLEKSIKDMCMKLTVV